APRKTRRRSQCTSERSAGPISSGQQSLTCSPSAEAGSRISPLTARLTRSSSSSSPSRTPVVFVITGVIFYLTAATYAEATARYAEAGGSSSFARHAFNELGSFFAAWAQMLNYTIPIAISAFFVPHYLGGLFWPALQHGPGDILFGIGVVSLLSVINVVGVREAAGLNILLAVTDLATQLLLVI